MSVLVFSAYSFLSIIFTYPVAFSSNKIPGHGDAFWFLWDFWWFKTALLNFISPYYTHYIYHPIGVSLASSTITPLNAVASIPLQLAFGLVSAYKIIWIFSFILSGYGTFLLVKYLVGDPRAAFVSGLIFMFCPYHFAHALGHMNLISIQWIPFYIMFLIKTVNEKNGSNAFIAALFLLLNALSCYYYIIYLSVFTALYLIYVWRSQNEIQIIEIAKKVGIMTITFAIVFTSLMYPVIKEMLNSDYVYYGGFVEYSADVLGFVVPSIFHPVFKGLVSPIYSNFTGNTAENTVFVGYTVILFSLLAFIKIKTKEIKFWVLSGIVFFVLSLGPILHINGIVEIIFEGYISHIPLPYIILMKIPIFSLARVPSRWTVLLMLSLSILVGYGLKYLFSRYNMKLPESKFKINALFIIISCLILFEFLAIPYTMSSAEVPSFYKQISNDGDNYAIFEIPNLEYIIATYADYMYYQSIHEKMLVNGFVSRTPSNVIEFFAITPIFSHLIDLHSSFEDEDILEQNLTGICQPILNYYGIRYIVLHPDRMTASHINSVNQFLKASVDKYPIIHENDSIIVYKVNDIPSGNFMSLGSGWHGLENWEGTSTRWMSNEAVLIIYSNQCQNTNLSFRVLSFYRSRDLIIHVNDGSSIETAVPNGEFLTVSIPVNLKNGTNIIKFHVPEGCESPYHATRGENLDTRCLSLAFQNIRIRQ
jgi:hypothetical protein